MCDFKVGDEVVCVDATPRVEPGRAPTTDVLEQGAVYTVTFMGLNRLGEVVVMLHLVQNGRPDWGFHPDRFRKVERRNLTEWLSQSTDLDEEQRFPAPVRKKERVK